MKLLLDEMYAVVIAEQLRARGIDAASVHEPLYRRLEGASDTDVFDAARADGRVLVTENVPDLRRLEDTVLAAGEHHAGLIFTTNRQFPRGEPAAIGLLVRALEGVTGERQDLRDRSIFLSRAVD